MVDAPAETAKTKTSGVLSLAPAQLRAARALLGWTRTDCARISELSPETIKNIEHDVFVPTQETIGKIIGAFSRHGVEFFTLHGVASKNGPEPSGCVGKIARSPQS